MVDLTLARSVTPSLIAWTSLLLPSLPAQISLCTAGLTAALVSLLLLLLHLLLLLPVLLLLLIYQVLDLKQLGYPAWFRGLRFILSLVRHSGENGSMIHLCREPSCL